MANDAFDNAHADRAALNAAKQVEGMTLAQPILRQLEALEQGWGVAKAIHAKQPAESIPEWHAMRAIFEWFDENGWMECFHECPEGEGAPDPEAWLPEEC